MIKKRNKKKFSINEHLEFWVTKTTYADRLKWLEDANKFVSSLKDKKSYQKG